MLRIFLVLSIPFITSSAAADSCLGDVISACRPAGGDEILINCNAKYGKIQRIDFNLHSFANKNIALSFQFLLLSTHFNNYEKNRKGFGKLYLKLSDKAWNDGVELIKYMAKRGLTMDFHTNLAMEMENNLHDHLYELESLAKSLDIQKSLAKVAHDIHKGARDDADVMSYFENNYIHTQRDTVRELAGHVTDLKNLVNDSRQSALNVYLFDAYLQKLY